MDFSEYHYSRSDGRRYDMETENVGYQPQNAQNHHGQQHERTCRDDPTNALSPGRSDTHRSDNFQRELEEYMTQYKKEKVAQLLNEKEEKKEALEQLKNYHPWGRPGGGAPKEIGNQKMVFTEYHTDPAFQKEVPGLNFGGEGGGDPLKTISGHRRTEVVADPDTRCRDYRQAHPMRYANSKERAQDLKEALQRGMEDRAFREEQDRKSALEMEYIMNQYNPFGKPGGGAPLSQRDRHHPKQTSLDIGTAVGHGAPIRDGQGYCLTKLKHTMDFKHGVKTVDQSLEPETSELRRGPFGFLKFRSPGGGHPVYDEEGKLITCLHQPDYDPEYRSKKLKVAELISRDAENEMAALKLKRLNEEQQLRQASDRSFQDLMDSFQSGKPKRDPCNGLLVGQHRVSTDVSQPRPSPRQNKALSDTLKWQMEVCKTDRKLEEVAERHKAQQHYVSFPERFYQPNLDNVHYKNLDRILHNMPNGRIVPETRHHLNNVPQYHNKYYQPRKFEKDSTGYTPLPPFATHERIAQTYR